MNTKDIIPDKNQPRKYFSVEKMVSLKDSIKKHGIITPLIVQKEGDKYLIIDGERRFRVATELGIKDVPVQIVVAKNDFNRMVEQFHIQEQHESWTATEKAMAIVEIAEVSKLPLKEVCNLLSIEERAFRYYKAFADLQSPNKKLFLDYSLNVKNAEKIGEVKRFAKKITEDVLKQPFTKTSEGKIERILVEKIKNKEIREQGDYSRIKDSFRSNPKLINEFMTTSFDIDENFITSNAKGAKAIRNMITSTNYVVSNGRTFLKEKSVELTHEDVNALKNCVKVCEDVMSLA